MSNEGLRDTTVVISEMRKTMAAVRLDCQYEDDYTIRVTAVGTGGFLPETINEIARTFSSDPLFFLLNKAYLELGLMKPISLRQSGQFFNLTIELLALNGVLIQNSMPSLCFTDPVRAESPLLSTLDGDSCWTTVLRFFVHDMRQSNSRHVLCRLKLPKKHKKILHDQDVLKITVTYRDIDNVPQEMTTKVKYDSLPAKDKYNDHASAVAIFEQETRLRTARAFGEAANCMRKLNRRAASAILTAAIEETKEKFTELVTKWKLTDEAQEEVNISADLYARNLEMWARQLGDMSMSWDDLWGALKCLEQAVARESETIAELYAPDAELFLTCESRQTELRLCDELRRVYVTRGLNTKPLELYELMLQAKDEEERKEERNDHEDNDRHNIM